MTNGLELSYLYCRYCWCLFHCEQHFNEWRALSCKNGTSARAIPLVSIYTYIRNNHIVLSHTYIVFNIRPRFFSVLIWIVCLFTQEFAWNNLCLITDQCNNGFGMLQWIQDALDLMSSEIYLKNDYKLRFSQPSEIRSWRKRWIFTWQTFSYVTELLYYCWNCLIDLQFGRGSTADLPSRQIHLKANYQMETCEIDTNLLCKFTTIRVWWFGKVRRLIAGNLLYRMHAIIVT